MSSENHPYTVITPDTPLEELEAFFASAGVDFALGQSSLGLIVCELMGRGESRMGRGSGCWRLRPREIWR